MTDGKEQKLRIQNSEVVTPTEAEATAPSADIEKIESAPELGGEQAGDRPAVEVKTGFSDRISLRRKPKNLVLPQVRDEVTVKIEKILEDGVGDAYSRLSPIQKQEFKLKGEEVARQIRDMVKDTHVKVKKILRLVLEWLKLLPGVNRFFLEQEAKIKTDRIIALTKHKL